MPSSAGCWSPPAPHFGTIPALRRCRSAGFWSVTRPASMSRLRFSAPISRRNLPPSSAGSSRVGAWRPRSRKCGPSRRGDPAAVVGPGDLAHHPGVAWVVLADHRVSRWPGADAPNALRPNNAAWYAKSESTFSDAIAAVRRVLWAPPNFSMSRPAGETITIATGLLNRVFQTLCLAA
jgi:hypothetical protein